MKPTSPLSNRSFFQRQMNQADRIAQGVRSGELSGSELRQLVKQQHQFHRQAAAAYADDGRIGLGERRDLRASQRQASRDIFESKHNSVRQPEPCGTPSTP